MVGKQKRWPLRIYNQYTLQYSPYKYDGEIYVFVAGGAFMPIDEIVYLLDRKWDHKGAGASLFETTVSSKFFLACEEVVTFSGI